MLTIRFFSAELIHIAAVMRLVDNRKMYLYQQPTNDRLSFLDMLVQKLPSGDFEAFVYRKETNADAVLHFDSNHPAYHKRSCIKALFGRVDTHCSSDEARRQEKTYLFQLFHDNGYRLNFIKRALRQGPLSTTQTTSSKTPQPMCRPLPYTQGVSELIARHLRPYNHTKQLECTCRHPGTSGLPK